MRKYAQMYKVVLRSISENVYKRLFLRRLIARPLTCLRANEKLIGSLRSMAGKKDAWAHNMDQDAFLPLRSQYGVDFKNLLPAAKLNGSLALVAFDNDPVVPSFLHACEHLGLVGKIFDPRDSGFFSGLLAYNPLLVMSRPSHITKQARELFREKMAAVADLPDVHVTPDGAAIRIYEAKRELAYFLQINNIPHPQTWVFYKKQEAISFLEQATYPIVFKTHNGAGASGVEILYTREQALQFVNEIFDHYYINKSISDYRDIDYGYVLLQEFIPEVREFRLLKIGDSWFGHEKYKLDSQEFMSGSGVSKWTPPSETLLNFCNDLAQRYQFETMCFDIFQTQEGDFLVNELQTWFGSYNPSQMYINDVPGRYILKSGVWQFEPGLFNDYESVALRIVAAIHGYNSKQNTESLKS